MRRGASVLNLKKNNNVHRRKVCAVEITITHFSVTFTSLSSSLLFRDAILDSASFDSATKSDVQATGIDLKKYF